MKQRLLKSMLLLCALVVGGVNSAWADVTWERVTSISTLRSGGTFIMGYEATANSGVIVPLRTDACAATTSANGMLYSGTGTGTTSNGSTIDMSSVTETAKYELYITASTVEDAINMQLGSNTGNYIGCPNSKNTAKLYSSASDNTAYTLTIGANDIFTLECKAADTGSKYKYLKYNTGNPRFANYSTAPEKIVFYKKVEGSTPNCATPTFSPAGGTYTSAQNVTISTTTDAATIYYTTDGSTPTTSSNVYSSAIPVSTTTTIKAIAVKNGYDNSSVASATYTFVSLQTISAVRTQGTGDVYTQGVVTYVNGKTAYIQDNTAAVAVYNSAANLTVSVGDEITVSGTLGTYNSLLQIQTPTINVESQGNSVTPVVKTIAEINEDNAGSKALQCMMVKIEDATVTAKSGTTTTNATVRQGENTIEVRNIAQDIEYNVNDLLTLQGNVGIYNNNAQIINPSNVDVTQNVSPAINVANNVIIEFDATSGEITYTIDNPTSAQLTAAITTGNWISNVQVDAVNNKITFTAEANTGEQRTATITLTYEGAETKVVTITQKKNGVAILPFAWAGGASADFLALYGVSANSLGADYGSSHNPYNIKFDATDDYIQIRTDKQPGSVTIGIKMIGGGSKSTITVQASSNGTDYENVEELEISGSLNDILTLSTKKGFKATDRYVRLLFKKGSNVGVGPITIAEGVSVEISSALYTTYCNATKSLDFEGTGVKAYVVSNIGASRATLTEVTKAPANTPLVLKAEAEGTYALNVTNAADEVGTNYLLASDGSVVGATGIYALGNKASGVGFYKVKDGEIIPAGKCYLNTNASTKEFLGFSIDDDETAIESLTPALSKGEGAIYNLAGLRLSKMQKGINIVGGKKVLK